MREPYFTSCKADLVKLHQQYLALQSLNKNFDVCWPSMVYKEVKSEAFITRSGISLSNIETGVQTC